MMRRLRSCAGLELTQEELVSNIIGAIGSLDAYQLPDAKGFTSLTRALLGETDAKRQRYRDEALGTTMADVRAFADVLDAVSEDGRVVVLGGEEAVRTAAGRRGLGGWSGFLWRARALRSGGLGSRVPRFQGFSFIVGLWETLGTGAMRGGKGIVDH